MIFTQPIFFAFLAITFAAYWLLRGRREAQLTVLLIASAIFYGWWNWRFLGLIGLVIVLSWLTALQAAKRTPSRRTWLVAGIAGNLAVLGIFKYAGFFTASFAELLGAIGLKANVPVLNIILPVGISFYVFQAISYIVDTARDDLPAEPRLRRVALYIAFFPQLVAGPIVRAASFFPQMEYDKRLTGELLSAGLRAFLLGFAYKAGIADNLAPLVDPVYGDALLAGDAQISGWSNGALIGATIAFAAQIYFDFAGYSLMAIGVARWFGFFIPKNFDHPYASPDIADFWRRWHISLSSWLRDYLYIPLGGNRGGKLKTYRNLMATMLLGGLWHGAAWTFVVWGALHGAALAVHRALYSKSGHRIGFLPGLILTQLFVLLAWVPFRAESFSDTLEIWYAFTGLRQGGEGWLHWTVWLVPVLIALDALLGLPAVKRLGRAPILREPLVYWGAVGALTAILLALYPLEARPFVYFQF
ncbi:MAG: MBOAT family O-acyltransferase [Hyphomonas sp.]|uniref:MBOAT family O-acyltransferase n=1 Tax=Hyphomonas sp. TaxID=87 RepID=UPI00352769DC